jgi:hypothetical protein
VPAILFAVFSFDFDFDFDFLIFLKVALPGLSTSRRSTSRFVV